MSIYPDKKNGKLTGRWYVEVQIKGQRKRGRFNTMEDAKRAGLAVCGPCVNRSLRGWTQDEFAAQLRQFACASV